jgi:hypothetical protein
MRHHVKATRLRLAQRDGSAIDADLEGIAPERSAQEGELGPLDEAEDHQPLDGRVGGLDRFDTGAITGLQVRKCQGLAPRQARK